MSPPADMEHAVQWCALFAAPLGNVDARREGAGVGLQGALSGERFLHEHPPAQIVERELIRLEGC